MNIPSRVLACAALGLIFTRGLAASAENYLRLACSAQPDWPGCSLQVTHWVPQWRDPLAPLPLVVWLLATAVVTAVLMALWRAAARARPGRPAGVTLCVFAMGQMALGGAIGFQALRIVLSARGGWPDEADGSVNIGLWVPLLTSALITVAAAALWQMREWGRLLTVVLGVSLASLTVLSLVQFYPQMSAGGPGEFVPLVISMLLGPLQWALIVTHLLRPGVVRQFRPAAAA